MTWDQDGGLAALGSVSSRLSAALASIGEHHWTLATPCVDWDLSALVDHVTGGNWFTALILDGGSAEDAVAETMALFGGTSVTRERAISSVAEQLTAFHNVGVLDQTHHHVAGDLTGHEILHLRLHDLILHNWDIDQTLGPPASIPPDLLRWGLGELSSTESLAAEHFGLAATPLPEATEDFEAAYLERFGR